MHLYNNNNVEMDANGEYWLQSAVLSNGPKVVFDVGANKGEWIRYALRLNCELVGYAFEPAPSTFVKLRSQIQCNRLHAHQMALSDVVGTLSLWHSEAYSNLTSIVYWSELHPDPSDVSQIEVPCVTGDKFCAEQQIRHIDFLKIDAEGYDFNVLCGFKNMLRNNQIDCIQFEYNEFSLRAGSSLRRFFSFLGNEFIIGRLLPNGIEVYEYSSMLDDFHQSNYVAISRRFYGQGLASKVKLVCPKGYLGVLLDMKKKQSTAEGSAKKTTGGQRAGS
jgi:FkbM family methyltransferase